MVTIRQLSNGIRVVTERMPYFKTAAFGVWVKVGSACETKETNGISHVIEHMLFQGTKTRSARQLAQDSAAIGDNVNAFTSKEYTSYYGVTLSEYLPRLIDMIGDMISNSIFDPDALSKEKGVILEEIDMYDDSPEDLVHELLQQQVWNGHPLGFMISGEKETVKSFTREQILAFLAEYYTAENMVLSVAGHFDEEEVLSMLEKAFGGIASCNHFRETRIQNAREALQRVVLSDTPYHREYQHSRDQGVKEQTNAMAEADSEKGGFQGLTDIRNSEAEAIRTRCPVYRPCFCMRAKDIEQLHMNIAFDSVPADSPKKYTLAVLNSILGGSNNSRLFQVIREELGLAYSVYSYASSYESAGLFQIDVTLNPSQAELAFERIFEETDKLKTSDISDAELAVHISQVKTELIMGAESPKSRMNSNAKAVLARGRIESIKHASDAVAAVSVQDIAGFAKEYLKPETASMCLVGPIGKRLGTRFEKKLAALRKV
ncbi:MAG: insulinase family protein [Lachnospiraceae bacterium]|nr:insulinase family protein [Lachnospiraceae bacterium]